MNYLLRFHLLSSLLVTSLMEVRATSALSLSYLFLSFATISNPFLIAASAPAFLINMKGRILVIRLARADTKENMY